VNLGERRICEAIPLPKNERLRQPLSADRYRRCYAKERTAAACSWAYHRRQDKLSPFAAQFRVAVYAPIPLPILRCGCLRERETVGRPIGRSTPQRSGSRRVGRLHCLRRIRLPRQSVVATVPLIMLEAFGEEV